MTKTRARSSEARTTLVDIRPVAVAQLLGLLSSQLPAPAQKMAAPYQEVPTYLGRAGDFKANVLEVNVPRRDFTTSSGNDGAWPALACRRPIELRACRR